MQIRVPHKDELPEVEQILEDSLRANPISRLLFGGVARPGQIVLANRWTTLSEQIKTLVYVADEKIVGVMRYADLPYCEPRGWRQAWRFLIDTVLYSRWRLPCLLFKFLAPDKHPKYPHRHLMMLGVQPEHQGKSIGSSLLRRFLDDANRDEMTTVLETDTSRALNLYKRFGYTVESTSKWGPYEIWHLTRPPDDLLKPEENN